MPYPLEQLLFGMRDDGPAQVKVYWKRTDQGGRLVLTDHVKAAVKQELCEELGLRSLIDLIGFPYRKVFSSYLRMVDEPVARPSRSKRRLLHLVKQRCCKLRQEAALAAWQQSGAQGVRLVDGVRHGRDTATNQRIGKALNRLEAKYAHTKLDRRVLIQAEMASVSSDTYGKPTRPPITIKNYKSYTYTQPTIFEQKKEPANDDNKAPLVA